MQSSFGITRVQTLRRALLICLLAPAAVASAQDGPYSAWNKMAYGYVKATLARTAEKMPEESYAFRPTDAVRSFGESLPPGLQVVSSSNCLLSLPALNSPIAT